MGADESVLHGQRDDQGHRASGGHDSVSDKIAKAFAPTENPSTDQADGFVVSDHPLTSAQEKKVQRNITEDIDFAKSVHSFIAGDIGKEVVLRIGTTPYSMRIVGANAIPMVIPQSVLQNSIATGKIRHDHTGGHELTEETISRLPEAIRNPIFVCRGNRPNTLALISDITDSDGRNLLIAFTMDVQGAHSKVNRVTTVFGKKNLNHFLEKAISNGDILAMNMKKAEELFSHIGIQPPKSATILCFDDSITYTDENVKRFSEISSQSEHTGEPEKAITKERKEEMLAAFASKHGLDILDVYVRKDKTYTDGGRAYDLLVKQGKTVEFQARAFTLGEGAIFTEMVLQSALANLEQSAEFQQFLSFRQGQHTLFDQPEEEKVDTSSNLSPEQIREQALQRISAMTDGEKRAFMTAADALQFNAPTPIEMQMFELIAAEEQQLFEERMDAESIAIRQREIEKLLEDVERRLTERFDPFDEHTQEELDHHARDIYLRDFLQYHLILDDSL